MKGVPCLAMRTRSGKAEFFASQFFNAEHDSSMMNHRVAVGANRTQISNRINLILRANIGQRFEVVNVNEPLTALAINLLEIEFADLATTTVVVNAFLPCDRIALVAVDRNLTSRTLEKLCWQCDFVGFQHRLSAVLLQQLAQFDDDVLTAYRIETVAEFVLLFEQCYKPR